MDGNDLSCPRRGCRGRNDSGKTTSFPIPSAHGGVTANAVTRTIVSLNRENLSHRSIRQATQ